MTEKVENPYCHQGMQCHDGCTCSDANGICQCPMLDDKRCMCDGMCEAKQETK